MSWTIRYRPDTPTGRRITGHGPVYATRAEAEDLLRLQDHPDLEIVETSEDPR